MNWIWIYIVSSFFMGILIGLIIVFFNNRKIEKRIAVLASIEKTKKEIEEYHKVWNYYLLNNIDLVNKISNNYSKIYQNMLHVSSKIKNKEHEKNTRFFHSSMNKNQDTSREKYKIEQSIKTPLDYPEDIS
ncbi:ZapG family protein [Candidatus Tachikawaea gelatinosa]|uniref:Z-ring associated protein G n=1 Tax=Candidatus Tachikawaea gelatinosa TaxID=1410383 RepID=A0A090ALQ7_9ENTR|nr:DUF1043 family protein [Candidatus Tachikawaea gelatinosa]BAP58584.1 putative cytochrome d ubiquinol oxidase subunit III [Candidatus Tachikawaea gelatinosa]